MKVNRMDKTNFTSRPIGAKELRELKMAIKKGTAFVYDVDTTNGFMLPNFNRTDGIRDGLHVAGAESILPAFTKLKNMFKGIIPKFETVDAHQFSDPELKYFKDAPFNSDIHSQKGTWGGEKTPETVWGNPDILIEVEPEKLDVPSVAKIKEVLASKGIIRLEKNENDSLKWGNEVTGQVEENKKGLAFFENLRQAGAKIALVTGVATDYCVKDAVAALKRFGIKPIVVENCIKEFADNCKAPGHPVYDDVPFVSLEQLGKVLDKVQ